MPRRADKGLVAHHDGAQASRPGRHRRAGLLLAALACCLPVTSPGDSTTLNLQRLASYDPELPHQKAFTECELATSIPARVAVSAEKHFGRVVLVDDAKSAVPGLALAIRVAALDAPSGGGWSGKKGLTLEGELYRDGQRVDTFRQSRLSKGKSVGLIKVGTCSILNSNTRALADQMADWLQRKLWSLGLEN